MWEIGFGIIFAWWLIATFATPPALKADSKWYKSGYDDTDDIANKERSGMALWIDYGTGCHYLQASPFTPLVPRMDKNGKQVCEYQQKEIKTQEQKQ